MGKCISLCCLARWRRTVTSSAAPWLERITGSGHQRTGPPTREPGLVATPVSTVNDLSINAIAGSSASDIWAVGQTVTAGYHNRQFTSVVMHYNGSAWTQVAVPDNSGLLDVAALSPTGAWALAADGSVLNWNGSAWSVQATLAGGNTVLAALSPTDVWVGGVVSLTHYNVSTWSPAPIPSGISTLTGAASLTAGHVWFTGDYVTSAGVTEPAVLSTGSG